MSEKDLIEKIPNWEYTYLYEGSRSFGKSYTQHLLDEKDKEIERLNNILDTLMQDMALLNATGKKEIKPKYVFDRIVMLRGVDKE